VRVGQQANLPKEELAQLTITVIDRLIADCRYVNFSFDTGGRLDLHGKKLRRDATRRPQSTEATVIATMGSEDGSGFPAGVPGGLPLPRCESILYSLTAEDGLFPRSHDELFGSSRIICNLF